MSCFGYPIWRAFGDYNVNLCKNESTRQKLTNFKPRSIFYESMVSFVSRRYMRGENGKESLMVCGLSCLQICIGKQNVEIIDKSKSKKVKMNYSRYHGY